VRRLLLPAALLLAACGADRPRSTAEPGPDAGRFQDAAELDATHVDAAPELDVDAGDPMAEDAVCLEAMFACRRARDVDVCGVAFDACLTADGTRPAAPEHSAPWIVCDADRAACVRASTDVCNIDRCGVCTPRCPPEECLPACVVLTNDHHAACLAACQADGSDCGCSDANRAEQQLCHADACAALRSLAGG